MGVDLGTYRVRVTLQTGDVFHTDWETSARSWVKDDEPPFEDEAKVLDGIRYYFTDGNGSCDCNIALYLSRERGGDEDWDTPCGNTLRATRIDVTAPDGRHMVAWCAQEVE